MDTTKICYKCKQEKLLEDFFRTNRGSATGRSHECKNCARLRSAERRKRHPEKIAEANLRYNSKRRKQAAETTRKWRLNNSNKANECSMRRYARKQNATPKWLTSEQISQMQEIYAIAKLDKNK